MALMKNTWDMVNLGLAARAVLITGRAHPLLILANAPALLRAARWGLRKLRERKT
ncbi:MAG: hypothetical protein QGH73_10795 [Rhodospirillales bacterium]|jgi:hypothetical protein|nr:hypothetical protein [Rhodospirillales bacterium]MDP6643012.1 hypothetical protein [Rhodospirillales bacterium]MDP6842156.1 hypothetical protein [Rhodospirillales bacterium]|tara:strand:- start:254 stop:418 length:165 start_codon:yes stop_codon:yes gene_type:complete